MAAERAGGRSLVTTLLAASDVLLASSLPLLFFDPFFAVLMFLAFPAGLALARWQYGLDPWEMRRQAARTTLMFLAGLFILFFLLVVAGRTRPLEFDVSAALMFLGVIWAGLSTYAIGLISVRASWRPADAA